MSAASLPTEDALQACRDRFSRILDKYRVSPADRQALNEIELEFFRLKSELLAKIDQVVTALEEAPGPA